MSFLARLFGKKPAVESSALPGEVVGVGGQVAGAMDAANGAVTSLSQTRRTMAPSERRTGRTIGRMDASPGNP